MQLVYAGFDTIDVAIQVALPEPVLATLRQAKEQAAKDQEPILAELGPARVPVHVQPSGRQGGYAFVCKTGPLGEVWAFKDSLAQHEWNGFVSIRAGALAAYGYEGARAQMWQRLKDLGGQVGGHSLNRADYAMDFVTDDAFELRLENFIAHPRAKVLPHWDHAAGPASGTQGAKRQQAAAVFSGRRLLTVTVGKMPGRQVIVYDKRHEAIEKHKPFWFEVWDIDRADTSKRVWRVEVRAGKDELKERWGIRTFDDLESSIGDAFRYAVQEVRYVDDWQTDSNVSRQALHELWRGVTEHVETGLMRFRSGLLPGQVKEVERIAAAMRYMRLVLGNLAGVVVAAEATEDDMDELLSAVLEKVSSAARNDLSGRFAKSVERARRRLHFIIG